MSQVESPGTLHISHFLGVQVEIGRKLREAVQTITPRFGGAENPPVLMRFPCFDKMTSMENMMIDPQHISFGY